MRLTRTMIGTILGAALAAATPAAAADTAADSKPTKVAGEAKDASQKDRVICKRVNSTESRLRSFKACHTAEQWKKIDRDQL